MALQRSTLRLVETQPFHEELPVESRPGELHSLHSLVEGLDQWNPFETRELVLRYTQRGDTVLVQPCGYGAATLECTLLGRTAIGVDSRVVPLRFASARVHSADIAEVALFLQMINLKRPVDLRQYNRDFNLFFDVDTFCELWNLRHALAGTTDRISRFVEALVGSVIHGHTASHLSVYTSPREGLSAEAQARVNRKRNQIPGYRAVAPRILKKSAFVTRDGISSDLHANAKLASFMHSDPHNMHTIKNGSVDLVLTLDPFTCPIKDESESWVRRWFVNSVAKDISVIESQEPEAISEYCSASLFEAARIVRSGGRVIVHVPLLKADPRRLEKVVACYERLISEGLSRFWRFDGVLELGDEVNCLKQQGSSSDLIRKAAIVLRRK